MVTLTSNISYYSKSFFDDFLSSLDSQFITHNCQTNTKHTEILVNYFQLNIYVYSDNEHNKLNQYPQWNYYHSYHIQLTLKTTKGKVTRRQLSYKL